MKKNQYVLLLFVWGVFVHGATASAQIGPFFDWAEDVPVWGYEQQVSFLGPIGSYAATEKASFTAVRPLWSHLKSQDAVAHDFLWPLGVYRASQNRQHSRYILWYYYNNVEEQKRSFGLIPILFFKDYREQVLRWGLFPVYGHLNDFLGYDEWRFALFPLYSSTKKLSKKSTSIIWPLINYEVGDKSKRVRFLPFFASNRKDGISLNNSYLWPFFSRYKSLKDNSDDRGWMLWPLVGHKEVEDASTWTYLWPFFSHTIDKDGETNQASYMWPFYQFEQKIVETGLLTKKKELYHKEYFWPFWGVRSKGINDYTFYLWPFGSSLSEESEHGRLKMSTFLPFYYSKDSWDSSGNKKEKFRKVWPFWSKTIKNGQTDTRILDLWPYRNMAPIERNWAPFWTFYRSVKKNGESDQSLLWGAAYKTSTKAGESTWGIFPFYSQKVSVHDAVDDNSAQIESKQDDILLGLIRLTHSRVSKTKIRLFWLFDF